MVKRLFCLLCCAIILSGCGKITINDKKQVNQTETRDIAEEETAVITEGDAVSDSNNTKSNDLEESNTKDSVSKENEANKVVPEEDDTDRLNQTKETFETISEQSKETEVAKKYNLPDGFVYVDDIIPTAELDIRYYTDYNFVGEKIDGYVAPLAILTTQAADALKVAADKCAEDGYHIRIYDAYRPKKAVQNFVRWAQTDEASMKEVFYPSMEKDILFKDGYISKKSRHSRGSTIDMTIVDKDGNEIDMGGYFDLLDIRSNYDTDKITGEQHDNREYLKDIMDEAGFDSIRTEWWHFQLRDEPYPDTYFDFDIE